jgi:hypothetical protein
MPRHAGAVLGMLALAHAAAAQFTQQGSKLVGSDAAGGAAQGESVAISADGNTAIVGGPNDNSNAGAAWVFTRGWGLWSQQWSQQGSKLVGTGAVGAASQGWSVALSADGNTAIVGGIYDNSWAGAAWVFARSGGVWSQQGGKLVGSDASPFPPFQGWSVALSADGNTAIVGGWQDNSDAGAAWVYTRSGGVWSQQGSKLVGTGAVGEAMQGSSVAISGDGNTAIVGGRADSSGAGAAWVFTRSGGIWSQKGNKLVGSDAVGAALQGISVAISADGNTAIVGGSEDNDLAGAAWVYTRSAGVWAQLGSKLVGTDAVGTDARQGFAVAISGDGTAAIVGGFDDNYITGAAWVFVAYPYPAPSVTGQPQSQTVQSGQSATLSVTATGMTPLYYQWYQGSSGDTSQPVGTNASSFTTPALTATTSYWVRVSNAGGHADSATAIVLISSSTPSITTQPQSQSIASGQTATLTVTATGATPLYYQWYSGASGDTSQPVGMNASSFTTPALTAATRYWVRVFNAYGQADSATATVSISSCALPSITVQPQSQSIQSGHTATLSVTATGVTPLYYQWYQGVSGDTSQPVGTSASSFTTPALVATTGYWVRIFNACGGADSATATITVGVAYRVRRYLNRQSP